MIKPLLKRIAFSSLIFCSAAAVADQSDYKLMVVEDQNTSDAIMLGQYETILTTDVTVNDDPLHSYEVPFNRCVASVKMKDFNQAETLCSQAIELLKASKTPRMKRNELTSFALSNRGVARMLASKDTAAIADFYEAYNMSSNELVSYNLDKAKEALSLQ